MEKEAHMDWLTRLMGWVRGKPERVPDEIDSLVAGARLQRGDDVMPRLLTKMDLRHIEGKLWDAVELEKLEDKCTPQER